MEDPLILVAIVPALVAIVIFFATPHVTPNRSLSRPLGDVTAQRARLRLVMGGGR